MQISAPLWRRLAALLYDSFILLALSFLYGAVMTFVGAVAGWHQEGYQPMFQHWLFTAGWILTLMTFYCWFWHKSGQTIGMRTWRLKLVDEADSTRTPAWSRCLTRALVAPPLVTIGGVGYWFSVFDVQKRSLHDRLSHTKVVLVARSDH